MAEVIFRAGNRITLPRPVREELGIKAGDKLVVAVHGDVVALIRKPSSEARALRDVGKSLSPTGNRP